MMKCEICKYQKDCPDVVEENSVYCLAHRRIPKNFNNEYIEKQQLISFLEDKIKEYKQILNLLEKQNASLVEKARARNRISAYEEVIEHINNFVNKGGKE